MSKNKIEFMEEYIKTVENARDELERKLKKIKEILKIHKDNKCVTCQAFNECFEKPSCDDVILQIIEE